MVGQAIGEAIDAVARAAVVVVAVVKQQHHVGAALVGDGRRDERPRQQPLVVHERGHNRHRVAGRRLPAGQIQQVAFQPNRRLDGQVHDVVIRRLGVAHPEAPLAWFRLVDDDHVLERVIADVPVGRGKSGIGWADGNPATLRIHAGHEQLHPANALIVLQLADGRELEAADRLVDHREVGAVVGRRHGLVQEMEQARCVLGDHIEILVGVGDTQLGGVEVGRRHRGDGFGEIIRRAHGHQLRPRCGNCIGGAQAGAQARRRDGRIGAAVLGGDLGQQRARRFRPQADGIDADPRGIQRAAHGRRVIERMHVLLPVAEQDDVVGIGIAGVGQQHILGVDQPLARVGPDEARGDGIDPGLGRGDVAGNGDTVDAGQTDDIVVGAIARAARQAATRRNVQRAVTDDAHPIAVAQQIGQHPSSALGVGDARALARRVLGVHRVRFVEQVDRIDVARIHVEQGVVLGIADRGVEADLVIDEGRPQRLRGREYGRPILPGADFLERTGHQRDGVALGVE